MQNEKNDTMSIIDHLDEIRSRLFKMVLALIIVALLAFSFTDFLRRIILMPAGDINLVFLSPPEAFLVNIRLAFTTAFLVTLPLIIYQVVAFLMPAFYKEERRVLIPCFFCIGLLFYGGFSFGYFVVFPIALRFFLGFSSADVQPMFTFNNYLAFFSRFHLSFALVFQVPLIFALLGRLGILRYELLKKSKKFALLIIVIASALLTPPDFVSQLLMILPLYLLFELGTFLVKLIEKKKLKSQAKEG